MRLHDRRSPVALTLFVASLAACGSSETSTSATTSGAHDAGATSDGGIASTTDGGSDSATKDGGASTTTLDAGAAPVACAPSWTPTPACGGSPGGPGPAPDFGPNVLIFDPSMSASDVQSQLDTVNGQMESDQFGAGRYAYFFKPGKYQADVKVGFYTQLLGLGRAPDDVQITGAVRAKADWLGENNATCNFWRGAENFSVVPGSDIDGGVMRWAVSQGTQLRRAHVIGTIDLDDGGWSSGGFIADSLIDTQIDSGSQQQFLTRNVDLTNWQGSNWNMVFVGDTAAPTSTWPSPPFTTVSDTQITREKPFIYLDDGGNYDVMMPSPKTKSVGRSWSSDTPPGLPLSIDRFYVAKADTDTSATINAALATGKHLILTPGIYHLDDALRIATANTVVLGLGLATLIPNGSNAVLEIGDVDGVTVGGLIVEAGTTSGATLVHVGTAAGSVDHSKNPTALFDLFCRIGGADVGTAESCVTIDSNDVLVDNTWLWRADHGAGADWNTNKSKNGLVVNGANVTIYGLFVEHFQEYQTLWNGENGSVYFYQSEMPYDPPSQADWMAPDGKNGYASYKVADGVTTHHAEGLGVYSVFTNDVQADDAIETATATGVVMHHMVTVSLASGSIQHIVNGTGGTVAQGGAMVADSDD